MKHAKYGIKHRTSAPARNGWLAGSKGQVAVVGAPLVADTGYDQLPPIGHRQMPARSSTRRANFSPVLAGQAEWEDVVVKRQSVRSDDIGEKFLRSDKCFLCCEGPVCFLWIGQIEGLRVGDIFAATPGSFGFDHPSTYLQMIPPIEWQVKRLSEAFSKMAWCLFCIPFEWKKLEQQLGLRSPFAGYTRPKTSSIIRLVFTFVSPQSPARC